MGQRPFIFQNVGIDLQGRQRIWSAVTKCGANLAFHPKNSGALHRCEIGENIAVRLEIEDCQLRRDAFYRERKDAQANVPSAEFAHRTTIESELQRSAFYQAVVQIGGCEITG